MTEKTETYLKDYSAHDYIVADVDNDECRFEVIKMKIPKEIANTMIRFEPDKERHLRFYTTMTLVPSHMRFMLQKIACYLWNDHPKEANEKLVEMFNMHNHKVPRMLDLLNFSRRHADEGLTDLKC